MSQKPPPKLTPEQEQAKAAIYSKRKPLPSTYLAGSANGHNPTPAPKRPDILLEVQICQYQNMPDFGFDVLSVTINGVNVQFYRACILHNGKTLELPMEDGQAFMSLEAANAFAEQEKQTGAFRRMMLAKANKIVVPGSVDFNPPRLH